MKYNQNPQSSINQQQQGTISSSGSQTMTKIEMADLSKIFSSQQQQQQQTSLSTSSSSSSSNLDNSDNSQSSSTGTLANVQGINVRIENQYDSRMYPCPSSVRLIFKKNHIQVSFAFGLFCVSIIFLFCFCYPGKLHSISFGTCINFE